MSVQNEYVSPKKIKININDKISSCIKETNNWSHLEQKHKFDNKRFDKEAVSNDISISGPKLNELLKNIRELDEADMKTHKKLFKHFIYSDIKSSYGAKLIASVLSSDGYIHAYSLKKTARGMSFAFDENALQSKKTAFATLTSTVFFDKPLGVNFRKQIIKAFNSRPDNVYGDNIRIIILDSGFREGIDLFDVKYVHLIEPISTPADEKQAIGRATRRCGQKGLTFDSVNGWPLYVYRYETVLLDSVKKYLVQNDKSYDGLNSFFDLFMKFSNIDPKKIALSNELERIGLDVAVDKELTAPIHRFEMPAQSGGSHNSIGKKILKKYGHLKWDDVVIRNECINKPKEGSKKDSISKFTPTQEFIRTYFTPKYKNPGMLLWHSVGTGKTCTAIATASSTFEVEGYTILYVTRHTLKASTWKDMFDNVCSIVVQDYLKKGMTIPQAHAARLRIISKGWFEPMSYRQFSNTLSDKNQFAKDLKKRNGSKDILHKTLIIIDEAHKLFASDVEGPEKADIGVIKEALMNSSKVSGKEGAKILLMTATPYTTDVMDLFRLINLCRPHYDQIPESFEDFSKKYLDENSAFTEKSKIKFYNKMAGYISYLNQAKDIRYFAYPIVKDIHVPMSDYTIDKKNMDDIAYIRLTLNNLAQDIKNTKFKNKEILNKWDNDTKNNLDEDLKDLKEELSKCKNEERLRLKEHEIELLKELKEALQKCDEDTNILLTEATILHKDKIAKLKEEKNVLIKKASKEDKKVLKEQLASEIKRLNFGLKYTQEKIKKRPKLVKCKAELVKEATIAKEKLKKFLVSEKCNLLTKKFDEENTKLLARKEEFMKNLKNKLAEILNQLEEKYKESFYKSNEFKKILEEDIKSDKSQHMALGKCLSNKIQPMYKTYLNNDTFFDDNDMEDIVDEDIDGKKNLFIIMGHGSEKVIDFDKRRKVPSDKVIVVFPVCSRPNYMNIGCQFIDIFTDPKYAKYIANPIKYEKKLTKALGHPIRVYLPNDYMPEMSTDLFLKFDTKTDIVLAKSGVYRINELPVIDRTVLKESTNNLGSDLCTKWSGSIPFAQKYSTNIHSEVFKKNIFKPAKSSTNKYTGLSTRSFKIADIIDTVGKGVYYYIGCRSSTTQNDPLQVFDNDKYNVILERSENQQKEFGRKDKIDAFIPNIKNNDKYSEISNSESITEMESIQEEKLPSLPPTPPEPQPPKKVLLRNNASEKIKIAEIELQLKDTDSISLDVLEKIINDLENITKSTKVLKLLVKVNDLKETYAIQGDIQTKLVMKKVTNDGKSYSTLNIVKYIKNENKTKQFQPILYGILNNETPDNDKNCTTSAVISQIKKLYNKEILLKLPKTFEEADSSVIFSKLCDKILENL